MDLILIILILLLYLAADSVIADMAIAADSASAAFCC
jgi:hypothetical protein